MKKIGFTVAFLAASCLRADVGNITFRSNSTETSMSFTDIKGIVEAIQKAGNIQDASFSADTQKKLESLTTAFNENKLTSLSADLFGTTVLKASVAGDGNSPSATIESTILGINETIDASTDIDKLIKTKLSELFDNTSLEDADGRAKISNIFNNAQKFIYSSTPLSSIAGNPFSTVSSMVGLSSSLALVSQKASGFVSPAISGLNMDTSENQGTASAAANVISLGGQYMSLQDSNNLSFSSYSFPLAYIMNFPSVTPGFKWISDLFYRYSSQNAINIHSAALGTGFMIPFSNTGFTLHPHVMIGGGLSIEALNAGLLWYGSLAGTYDIALGSGTLKILGQLGYGASIVLTPDTFSFLLTSQQQSEMSGLSLDPALSTTQIKLAGNYEMPINENLSVEGVLSHMQFFGSDLYVSMQQELGIMLGMRASNTGTLALKVGASYVYSTKITGFTIQAQLNF